MWRRLTVLLALLGVVGGAQCIGDDGLNTGKCFQPVFAKHPRFPGIETKALWIRWVGCRPAVMGAGLVIPPPMRVTSDVYILTGVRAFTGNQTLINPGALWLAFYVRTWMETDTSTPVGDRYQVWRFLVNGEVRPKAKEPPCGLRRPVHYFGYLDYAVNCRTKRWSAVFAVAHLCDTFTHNPLAKYPGTYHPGISYTLVSPPNFAPNPALPGVSGGIFAEAFRAVRLGLLPNSESEQAAKGFLTRLRKRTCICSAGPIVTPQFQFHTVKAVSACKSSVTTLPISILWGGSVQMSVGTFTGPGYPGKEELYFVVDPMLYRDGKTGRTRPDLFYGVATRHGFRAQLFVPTPRTWNYTFYDVGNVLLVPNLFFFSGMAGLYVSDILLYFNTTIPGP